MVWSSVMPRDGSNLFFRARNAMNSKLAIILVILKTIHCFCHPVCPRSNIEHTLSLYRAVRTLAHSRDRWLEHHRASVTEIRYHIWLGDHPETFRAPHR